MIKAIIFDLDGTLTDTLCDLADAVNYVLASYGYPTHKTESYKYFVGNGIYNLNKNAFPKGTEEKIISDAVESFIAYYRVHYLDKTKPYDGIIQLVQDLKKKGIKLAVCSNKVQEMTERVVEKFFGGIFSEVVGQSDRFPIKPHPAAPKHIMEKLGVTPSQTVFIGDSGVDMKTGKNAGCVSLGVLWGFRTEEELRENGADFIAQSPCDILNLIEKV